MSTKTPTIQEFLEHRWAHEQAHAEKDIHMADRAGEDWHSRRGINLPYSELATDAGVIGRVQADTHADAVGLMARFKPSTVRVRAEQTLRDIAAKRAILAECQRVHQAKDREYGDGSHDLADEVLCRLAEVYRDHPDWRADW